MERWVCELCKASNEGDYWEPCKGCGMLRQYADSNFAKKLLELAINSPDEHSALERKAADEHLKQQHRAIDAALDRIGHTGQERLEWLLRRVHEPPQTPEGVAAFERDIYFYGVLGSVLGFGSADGVSAPPKGYGKRILEKFHDTFSRVIARDQIPLSSKTSCLAWFPGHKSRKPAYYISTEYQYELEPIVFGELIRDIQEYGHLIKQCPAPAVRAAKGETCGKWFLAKRPNQDYCSATCVSRKTTRENPPSKKNKRMKRKAEVKNTKARFGRKRKKRERVKL